MEFSYTTGILNDTQIGQLSETMGLIRPYIARKVRTVKGKHVISYGQSSYGYDLTLSPEFVSYADSVTVLDPKNKKSLRCHRFEAEDYLDLPAGATVLARTKETITMPKNVTGVVLGKSTYARCGTLLNTTPIEAGWRGQVTLEITNIGPASVRLYVNEGIAQVLFFAGAPPANTYRGSYQDQKGVTLPKVMECVAE